MSERSEAIDQLAAALVKAQSEFPAIPKDSLNPYFNAKYADMADVVKVAGPILSANGLAVAQFVSEVNGSPALTTYLLHESGQFLADTMILLLTKADSQGQGSAITYARRYAYMAALGLVADEDDDGNASAEPAATRAQAPAQRPAPSNSGDMATDPQKKAIYAIATRKNLPMPDRDSMTKAQAGAWIEANGDAAA